MAVGFVEDAEEREKWERKELMRDGIVCLHEHVSLIYWTREHNWNQKQILSENQILKFISSVIR